MSGNLTGFQQFCGGQFWDNDLTWYTNQTDLTPCFQHTVLYWVPCGFLWLLTPFYLRYLLLTTADSPTPISHLNIFKMVAVILLFITGIADVIKYALESRDDQPLVLLVTPIILATSFVLVALIIQLERRRGFVTSGILFIFWFLLFVCGIFIAYSKILNSQHKDGIDDMFRFVIFFIYISLVLVSLILSTIAEHRVILDVSEYPCPALSASFLSRITFWWSTSIIITGFRRTLVEKDAWGLSPNNRVNKNTVDFENLWNKELKRCNWKRASLNRQKITERQNSLTRQDAVDCDERSPLLANAQHNEAHVQVKDGTKKQPSLFRVMAKAYGPTLLQAHVLRLFCDILLFVGPLLQSQLIAYTEDLRVEEWKGYLYASLFFVTALINSIFNNMVLYIGMTLGMRIRSAMMSAVYKKALTISNQARKETTVGEVVNLMSVDAQRLEEATGWLWLVWSSPLQMVIALYLLWQYLGPSVLAGLGVLILMVPANGFIYGKQTELQEKQMGLKDQRIKLLNEILNGIKVLKLYAWELSFREKVEAVRSIELRNVMTYQYLGALGSFSWTMASYLVMLVTLVTYTLSGHRLDAQTAFVSLSLLNILQLPINLLPMMLSYLVTAIVSVKRIGKFLREDDIDIDCVDYVPDAKYPINIQNGAFAWGTEEDDQTVLQDIDLRVEPGSLVAVVGQVGSGKSSLLSAILGEMEKINGKVVTTAGSAYVAQQAWIQNNTLRDNILFGKPFDQQRYENILEACALKPDLEILPAGDKTEIGEKGINLSGGQKQRVSLARALYQDSEIYLLDDPLSAVDAHVGKHMFQQVLGKQGILKNKTCLLVTHGVHWLPEVDQILVMTDGRISEQGTYEQLLSHDGPFAQFLKTYLLELGEEGDVDDPEIQEVRRAILERVDSIPVADDDQTSEDGLKSTSLQRLLSRQKSQSSPTRRTPDSGQRSPSHRKRPSSRSSEESLSTRRRTLSRSSPSLGRGVSFDRLESDIKDDGTLIEEENVEDGTVKGTVVKTFCKAVGIMNTFIVLMGIATYQAASVLANIWLTRWTSDPVMMNSSIPDNSSTYIDKRNMYMGVYGGIGAGMGFCVLIFTLTLVKSLVRASRELHRSMLTNVLKSPMSFFDTTPIGRIINRFSRDIETVDNVLPEQLQHWLVEIFLVLSSIVVIGYSTPLFLSLILPLIIFYYLIQRFYIPSSRQMRRLESVTRSPIYANFSETISGAATIRAYRQQDRFVKKSQDLVDHNLSFYFAGITMSRWLNFRLDLLGAVISLSAAIFAVLQRGHISPSIVGLSISYALQVTEELNWMVQITSDVETNIVSVERIKEYTETPTEAEWQIEETSPPSNWPVNGVIKFDNYQTRYRPGLDLVLKGISLNINGGEKVGIVGRTGAGKSSLTVALFRLIEAAGGTICVDGIHIATLGLHQLRSKLTILPQDPVLFSGSLRMNLDPFELYTDAEIWEALERAHLRDFVDDLPAALQHECGEGGQNLSVGQRQLMCLARTLLRRTKILILDEATAAVDLETDDLIQNTIRTEFSDCTVITIAHRINTIMDNDRVLVLDKGIIAEFEKPQTLLENENSIFYGMAKDAGIV